MLFRSLSNESQIKPYDIYHYVDFGLVFISSVCIEMALKGIIVLTAGRPHYANKGFTLDLVSKSDYFEKLSGLMNGDLQFRPDIEQAREFLEYSKKFPGKLIELPYIIESDTLEGKLDGQFRKHAINKLPEKLNYVLDVAHESLENEKVKQIFAEAKTIFVNALMGFTPHFNEGTIALDELIDTNREATKLYGGGDTMQELKRLLPGLYIVAIDSPGYYIFTGGGAVLKAIEQETTTGIEPIKALISNK